MNVQDRTRLGGSRATQLKVMLQSSELEFIMEAHNGLSARIVEEAGFNAIWASGLTISASLGLRDNNEASWTQVVDVVESMSDASSLPVLVDGDTGYGNFNNMRRLVYKLGQCGASGVCIEDKVFPKTNSFLRGESQPLADIEEFCGKICAGADSRVDEDFVIVARTEAMIVGKGVSEALFRAEKYHAAGADAIFVHSKESTPDQIFDFLRSWNNRCPVVIAPTTYPNTSAEAFHAAGVSAVIWANHLLRASVKSMQDVARCVHSNRSVIGLGNQIVPVPEVFRLQRDQELVDAERKYLPTRSNETGHACGQ